MVKRISVGLAAIVVALGATAGPALGDAHTNASCVGFETSGIAPAASSDEFPGGVRELQQFLHATFGTDSGAVIADTAKLHLQSHDACDAG
jgi:hypothetical protein